MIRNASIEDIPEILAIYNEVIQNSTAVYCEDPVSLDERLNWYRARTALAYPILVAEHDGVVAGYASFGDFRNFPGFRHTVEHSVHVAAGFRGRGIGTALIEALLPLARALDKHVMVAGVDASNHSSIQLHKRLGFVETGCMPEVGRKFGRWLDLLWLQRKLD